MGGYWRGGGSRGLLLLRKLFYDRPPLTIRPNRAGMRGMVGDGANYEDYISETEVDTAPEVNIEEEIASIWAKMDPAEKKRLERVRNIGIAVSCYLLMGQQASASQDNVDSFVPGNRHTLTAVKQRAQSESFFTLVESMLSTKSEAKMPWAQRWIVWSWRGRRGLLSSLRRRSVTGRRLKMEYRRTIILI